MLMQSFLLKYSPMPAWYIRSHKFKLQYKVYCSFSSLIKNAKLRTSGEIHKTVGMRSYGNVNYEIRVYHRSNIRYSFTELLALLMLKFIKSFPTFFSREWDAQVYCHLFLVLMFVFYYPFL